MTSQSIGIGVVGLGGRGVYLAREFNTHPGGTLTAICDSNPERLNLARQNFPDTVACYDTLDAMLADPKVQAVVDATWDKAHADNAVAILGANKHLFMEKPMAQSIEDCDRMIDAWAKSTAVFMVGLELRYSTIAQQIKQIVTSGSIGDIRLAMAVDNVAPGGQYFYHNACRRKEFIHSLALQKGTHTLDLMNWFIDSTPVRVYSESGLDAFGGDAPNDKRCADCDQRSTCPYFIDSNFMTDYGVKTPIREDLCVYAREVNVPDNVAMTVRYANGAKMTFTECHFTPHYVREFTLIGTQGHLYAWFNSHLKARDDYYIELRTRHSDAIERLYPEIRPGGHGGSDPVIQQAFLEHIARGKHTAPGLAGARNSAAIAIASRLSEDTGTPVTIAPCPPAAVAAGL